MRTIYLIKADGQKSSYWKTFVKHEAVQNVENVAPVLQYQLIEAEWRVYASMN